MIPTRTAANLHLVSVRNLLDGDGGTRLEPIPKAVQGQRHGWRLDFLSRATGRPGNRRAIPDGWPFDRRRRGRLGLDGGLPTATTSGKGEGNNANQGSRAEALLNEA